MFHIDTFSTNDVFTNVGLVERRLEALYSLMLHFPDRHKSDVFYDLITDEIRDCSMVLSKSCKSVVHRT